MEENGNQEQWRVSGLGVVGSEGSLVGTWVALLCIVRRANISPFIPSFAKKGLHFYVTSFA